MEPIPGAVFQRIPPLEAPVLKDARIVCWVRDLRTPGLIFPNSAIPTVAQLGSAPPIFHKGQLGGGWSQFIVPVSELRVGDRMTVSHSDLEPWLTEASDEPSLVYEGRFPILFKLPIIEVECRALTHEQIEAALPARLAALAAALKKVRIAVAPGRDNFGRDDSGLPAVQRRLYEAAAYAGWSDARIRDRSAAVAQLLEHWEKTASAAVQKLAASLPPPGTSIEVKGVGRVRAMPPRCVPKDLSQDATRFEYHGMTDSGCFIELEVTPQRLMAIEPIYCSIGERTSCLGRLRLVLANGSTTRPRVEQVRNEGAPFKPRDYLRVKDLAAGRTHLVVMDPRTRVTQEPSPLHPVLLQSSFGTLRLY